MIRKTRPHPWTIFLWLFSLTVAVGACTSSPTASSITPAPEPSSSGPPTSAPPTSRTVDFIGEVVEVTFGAGWSMTPAGLSRGGLDVDTPVGPKP